MLFWIKCGIINYKKKTRRDNMKTWQIVLLLVIVLALILLVLMQELPNELFTPKVSAFMEATEAGINGGQGIVFPAFAGARATERAVKQPYNIETHGGVVRVVFKCNKCDYLETVSFSEGVSGARVFSCGCKYPQVTAIIVNAP